MRKLEREGRYWGDLGMIREIRTGSLIEQRVWDDITGRELDWGGVVAARAEEMVEFTKHGVYEKVPIEECIAKTGKKPLKVRWVDINKGDDVTPEYRSRLVAKEIKIDKRWDLFAATPPLEAKKMLFSMAVTEGIGYVEGKRKEGMKLDFIDVRRAYFHADAIREVYVELCDEDWEEGMCGRLVKSMYGTRDAAFNWETAYSEFMEEGGFKRGRASPCVFHHPERNIKGVIHGDDFTMLGYEKDLDWFRKHMEERFEIKLKASLGLEEKDDKYVRILNRVVEWDQEGITYEADQRHAEIIIREMGLSGSKKGLSVPCSREGKDN